jgi:hypothetical protein
VRFLHLSRVDSFPSQVSSTLVVDGVQADYDLLLSAGSRRGAFELARWFRVLHNLSRNVNVSCHCLIRGNSTYPFENHDIK